MRNSKWYRTQLSHRGCIKVIEEIAKLTNLYGMISITMYGTDSTMFGMISTIRRWKEDAEKYHKLKELLK